MAVERLGVLSEELSALYAVLLTKMQAHEKEYYVITQQKDLMWKLIGKAHALDVEKEHFSVERTEEGVVLSKKTAEDSELPDKQ